jgi:hypothetical protein
MIPASQRPQFLRYKTIQSGRFTSEEVNPEAVWQKFNSRYTVISFCESQNHRVPGFAAPKSGNGIIIDYQNEGQFGG